MGDIEPGVKTRRKPRIERMPDTPDAVDIAMHAVASGKPLPDVARSLIEEQSRLVRAQTSEIRTRQVGERVRAALWAVLAIAAAAILVLFGALLVRAARSDALVVQSFRVPPTMAARGLTGEVVATQLLDELAKMQAQSESTRAASSYANNWENDLKIDIPNTGATAEQVWKLLRGWLGKETRISGEVIETKGGLALTARVGSEPGKRFVDAGGDLDALITKGADLIYSQTQPYRHAIGLDAPERRPERLAALTRLTANESAAERKWAYSGLSVTHRTEGNFPLAITMAEKALAIDPGMVPAMGNFSSAHYLLGHDQRTLDLHRRWKRLKVGKEYDPRVVAANGCNQTGVGAAILRDPTLFDEAVRCFETSTSAMSAGIPALMIGAALLRHDPAPALAFVAEPDDYFSPEYAAADTAAVRLDGAMVRGPGPALARAFADYRAALARRDAKPVTPGWDVASARTQVWPAEARALVMLGRFGEAQALIGRTPLDCYECVRTRGVVAEARGDRPAAQRWYLAAAKLGPRLPAAFADWGRLLAEAGRHQSAEVKLREAVRLAPDWADPLKTWGDMLAAQGKRAEAATKYDAALKLAPKWAALRAARAGDAARRLR